MSALEPSAVGHHLEQVVVFDAPTGTLVGILTPSTTPAVSRRAVVLCPGGWFGTATNRNRVFVRLARQLAASGATALRFDWHGVGESSGEIDRYRLDEPFGDDVAAAVRYLVDRGWDDITLVGVCFGARSAFAAADEPGVRQLVLLSFPVPDREAPAKATFYGARHGRGGLVRLVFNRSVLAGLGDPATRRVYRKAARLKLEALDARLRPWARPPKTRLQPRATSLTSAHLRQRLATLADRGVRTHLLFGDEDLELADFERFVDPPLRQLLDAPGGEVSVHVVPGNIHGFDRIAVQDQVIGEVVSLAVPKGQPPAGA